MNDKQNLMNYLTRRPYDGREPIVTFTAYMGKRPLKILNLPICERGLGSTGYDVFGVHWTAAQTASHYTPGQKPRYTDIETWKEEVQFPNIEKFDWEAFRRESEAFDHDLYVSAFTSFMGPFERATCLTDFEDCLVNLISEPEAFSDLIGAVADYKIAVINKACSIARPEVVNVHDDWGTARSTFMNPDLWRQVVKPHIKRIYDAISANGALVCQHSCGRIEPLIGDMVEMGCTMWEGQADCNDMAAIEARYGDKLLLLGDWKAKKEENPGPPPEDLPKLLDLEVYKPYTEFPAFLFD